MIKHRLLIAAVVLVGALIPSVGGASGINIEIGDKPFYRGATYWDNDWEMTWAPGHWSRYRHEWVHGHYIRGQHHRNHREDRRDDRRDDRHDRRDDR